MSLLTTTVDPRYWFEFFPANLKQKVVRLLKSEVKNYSCRETGQVPLVPPNKPKNDVPKKLLSFYSTFKSKTSANTHKSEQQHSVDQEIEKEIKFF